MVNSQFHWKFLEGIHYQKLMDNLQPIRFEYSLRSWYNLWECVGFHVLKNKILYCLTDIYF